ncbi:hypothetical protein [Roseateles chitinivorans]|uniref:hypothetical protein n=1 Tax=Roseateles chitinivorans TaxID=2917965 RepID=UPI003D67C295
MTLRTLVDIARRNKAAELGEATARLAGTPLPPGASAGRLPARDRSAGAPPRLWSLTAAGGRWRAEVLLDGRVHAVDASSGPAARIGPWRVVGPTPDGLHIEQIAAVGVSPRRLVLPPPGRGASTASYRFGRPRPPSTNAANATGSAVAAPTDRGEDIDAGHARADDEGSGDGGSEGDADAAVRRAAALPMPAVPARPGTSGPSTHAAPSVAPSIP